MDGLVRLLKVFSKTSRMEINQDRRVCIGLINTHISWNGVEGIARNGPKRGIFLSF